MATEIIFQGISGREDTRVITTASRPNITCGPEGRLNHVVPDIEGLAESEDGLPEDLLQHIAARPYFPVQ